MKLKGPRIVFGQNFFFVSLMNKEEGNNSFCWSHKRCPSLQFEKKALESWNWDPCSHELDVHSRTWFIHNHWIQIGKFRFL